MNVPKSCTRTWILKNFVAIYRTIIAIALIVVVVLIIADNAFNRYTCTITGERQHGKLTTHRYEDGFEVAVGDRIYSEAAHQARVEQGKVMNEPYEMNDPAIVKRTWEILRSRRANN